MSDLLVIPSDMQINGAITARTWNIGTEQIVDQMISPLAGILHTKVKQQRNLTYSQPTGTNVAAANATIFVCNGVSGTILSVKAMLTGQVPSGTGSDKTATVDVKKNGTTVLSAAVVLDSANVLRTFEAGTLSVTSIAAGDVLEVYVTIAAGTTGTAPQGLAVQVVVKEDPA